MAVEVWIGEKPEHPNERKAIIALANGLQRLDGLYLMLANFSVGGNTIDLVILKEDAIFVIEHKYCDGRVFGSVNGQWRVISSSGYSKVLNPGRKNPYNQVISYYYSFINFLNANRGEFLSEQKSRTIDFRACRRVVVIAPTLQEGSEIDVDWKVAVRGLDDLPSYLVTERSNEINLTDAELRAIPELLHCAPWQEVNELIAGVIPTWEETPDDVQPEEPQPAPYEEPQPIAPPPPPAPWWQQRWTQAAAGVVALLMILLLAFNLTDPKITVEPTPMPTFASVLPSPVFEQPELVGGCTYLIQQPVRKRKDPDTGDWQLVDISTAAQGTMPDVTVTLDQVSFCDNRIKISWTVQNQGVLQVRLALDNKNLRIVDNTNLEYTLDEASSEPRQIVVRPGSTQRGTMVIPRPINPAAGTLAIHVNSEPFPTTWLVPVPSANGGIR